MEPPIVPVLLLPPRSMLAIVVRDAVRRFQFVSTSFRYRSTHDDGRTVLRTYDPDTDVSAWWHQTLDSPAQHRAYFLLWLQTDTHEDLSCIELTLRVPCPLMSPHTVSLTLQQTDELRFTVSESSECHVSNPAEWERFLAEDLTAAIHFGLDLAEDLQADLSGDATEG